MSTKLSEKLIEQAENEWFRDDPYHAEELTAWAAEARALEERVVELEAELVTMVTVSNANADRASRWEAEAERSAGYLYDDLTRTTARAEAAEADATALRETLRERRATEQEWVQRGYDNGLGYSDTQAYQLQNLQEEMHKQLETAWGSAKDFQRERDAALAKAEAAMKMRTVAVDDRDATLDQLADLRARIEALADRADATVGGWATGKDLRALLATPTAETALDVLARLRCTVEACEESDAAQVQDDMTKLRKLLEESK